MRKILFSIAMLCGATASALDPGCTVNSPSGIHTCPQNSGDWYQNYQEWISTLNAMGVGIRGDSSGATSFGSGATRSTFTPTGVLQLNTALGAQYGGTGQTTLTAHSVIVGQGTSGFTSPGTMANGTLLIGQGAGSDPVVANLTGTANQIIVTNGAGTITLSGPQNLGTGNSPTFNGLTLTNALTVANGGTGAQSLTAHGVLVGEGTGAVISLGAATNGQIPIGSAGADPVLATITGTTNEVNVTNGAGSITLAAGGSNNTCASGQVLDGATYNHGVASGGTCQSYVNNTSTGAVSVASWTVHGTYTWTVPGNIKTIKITACGAGGGGANSSVGGGTNGGGGGSSFCATGADSSSGAGKAGILGGGGSGAHTGGNGGSGGDGVVQFEYTGGA